MEEDFRCSNSRCITYNKVCDNYRDCLEGEDEHCGKFLTLNSLPHRFLALLAIGQ